MKTRYSFTPIFEFAHRAAGLFTLVPLPPPALQIEILFISNLIKRTLFHSVFLYHHSTVLCYFPPYKKERQKERKKQSVTHRTRGKNARIPAMLPVLNENSTLKRPGRRRVGVGEVAKQKDVGETIGGGGGGGGKENVLR